MTISADLVRDYASAAQYLAQGRGGAGGASKVGADRPMPNGHHARLRRVDERSIALRLHETDVLTWHAPQGSGRALTGADAGTVTLDSGGWRTVTTKARMNDYLPPGWRLWSERGTWWLALRPWSIGDHQVMVETHERDAAGDPVVVEGIENDRSGWKAPHAVRFFDGLTIDIAAERVTNAPTAEKVAASDKRNAAMLTRIRKYVDGYMAAMSSADGLPSPNGGDCWFCLMFDRAPAGSVSGAAGATSDPEHLRAHMRERYYVPSLLVNALRSKGYRPEFLALHVGLSEDGAHMQAERSILGASTLKRALMRYMKARLMPTVAR